MVAIPCKLIPFIRIEIPGELSPERIDMLAAKSSADIIAAISGIASGGGKGVVGY